MNAHPERDHAQLMTSAPLPHPHPGLPPAPAGELPPDPLEHPDAVRAADAAAAENLLRCWIRETGLRPAEPGLPELAVPLASCGTLLRVPIRYWSATGHHRLGPATLDAAPAGAAPLDAVALAALLGREAAHQGGSPAEQVRTVTELVGRVADSAQRVADFLAARRADPEPAPGTGGFLDGEQGLLLGHPLHPTPKSREGLAGGEAVSSAPELRGSFPLHWFAVHPSVLASDSARTEDGEQVAAGRLLARIAGDGLALPPGTLPLPAHPWQARELRGRPVVARLLADGLLHDLGPHGEPWYPTSSVRTVHRPGAPVMLKLSLALSITNSRRENLRKELLRGAEVHRLLESGLGARWRAACPAGGGFDILRDPAWAGVDGPDGAPVPGLDVVIRENPFATADDVLCVAGLTAPRPWAGDEPTALTSRLGRAVASLAAATGRPAAAVAVEWFMRYLETVIRPVLRLDSVAGIALEAHQQNTLVRLDAQGWPAGGWYRDNQGYYFRTSRRDELAARLPGIGEESDTFVPDEVADERFLYYLGINNILGLIGAFGSQRLADERLLLGALRRFLAAEAQGTADRPGSTFAARLLGSATLRCKANLLTRLHGLDELVGPVDGQSVYVSFSNPVAAR